MFFFFYISSARSKRTKSVSMTRLKGGRGALNYQAVRAEAGYRKHSWWRGLWEAVHGKFQSPGSLLRIFEKRSKACLLFACNGTRLKDHSTLMPVMVGLGWRAVVSKRGQWITYKKDLYDVGLPYPSFDKASFNVLYAFSSDVNEVHPNTFIIKFR